MSAYCTYKLSLSSSPCFIPYLPLSLFQGPEGIRVAQPRWTRTLTVATRMPAAAISAARTWASLSWGCSTHSPVLALAPCWGTPGLRARLQPRYWTYCCFQAKNYILGEQHCVTCYSSTTPTPTLPAFNWVEIVWQQSSQRMIHFNFILIKAFSHPSCPVRAVLSLFSAHPSHTGCFSCHLSPSTCVWWFCQSTLRKWLLVNVWP